MSSKVCLALVYVLSAFTATATAQTTGSQTPVGSPYRVARSIAGAAGHEDHGKFVMDDPRPSSTPAKIRESSSISNGKVRLDRITSRVYGKALKAKSF
jgi:hypothetical protein